MTQDEALQEVLKRLASLGIEYMLTGSYASNIYGRVRSTFDADIVVSLSDNVQLHRLVESLGSDFYFDASSLPEVRESGGQFNAIHRPSGMKLDFYLPRSQQDRLALGRCRRYTLWGIETSVIAPEDLILAKLAWARSSGSARQIEDASGIFDVQRDDLDIAYLKAKAAELGLGEELDQIMR